MNYYIQGDPSRTQEIKAAFEKLGIDALDFGFTDKTLVYCSIGGCVQPLPYSINLMHILYSHPDYQELELPVEPKFKVHDWVVDGDTVAIIYDLQKNGYVGHDINRKDFVCRYSDEGRLHLWTIADAKDGDVLMCESGWTCIFKKLNEDTFDSYCFMSASGDIVPDGSCCHTLDPRINGKLTPTTVKQRILFFKKLQEAGYQWDADKKELNYDISNFSAGMPVLVRDRNFEEWTYALFSHYKGDRGDYKFSVTGSVSRQCVPFNKDTKHLLGTTDMPSEEYINW